jgi:hypothetical protein
MGMVIQVSMEIRSVIAASDTDAADLIEWIETGLGPGEVDVDLVLWLLDGNKGTGKSVLASAVMAGFQARPGVWSEDRLPGSAGSTAAANEHLRAVMPIHVVDDLAPSTDEHAARRQEAAVANGIRGSFNCTGRDRMTSGMKAQRSFIPKAVTIYTAENGLDAASAVGRTLRLRVGPDIFLPDTDAEGRLGGFALLQDLRDRTNAPARMIAWVAQQIAERIATGGWRAVRDGFENERKLRLEEARGPQLALTATFRCPQTICDAASAFVMKNPSQFTKEMRSVQPEPGTQVKVIRSDDPANALAGHLRSVSSSITGTATVQVLGRYRFERDVMPTRSPANLDVEFRTVHIAKRLEADYVVVVGMKTGTYGFPSSVAADPVLAEAQPLPELFPNAEERRLLYVALTRARRQVTLIAPVLAMSPFVVELADDPNVTVEGGDGRPLEICHVCRAAAMKVKPGRYGDFLSCTRWPACNGSRSLAPQREPSVAVAR